jgi:hypothetical protein
MKTLDFAATFPLACPGRFRAMPQGILSLLVALLLLVTFSPGASGGPLDGVYSVVDLSTFGGLDPLNYITPVTQDGQFINFFFLFGSFWSEAFGQIDETGFAQGSLFLPGDSPFIGGGPPYGTFEATFLPPEECPPARSPSCFFGTITVNGVTSEFFGSRVFGSN